MKQKGFFPSLFPNSASQSSTLSSGFPKSLSFQRFVSKGLLSWVWDDLSKKSLSKTTPNQEVHWCETPWAIHVRRLWHVGRSLPVLEDVVPFHTLDFEYANNTLIKYPSTLQQHQKYWPPKFRHQLLRLFYRFRVYQPAFSPLRDVNVFTLRYHRSENPVGMLWKKASGFTV